MKNIDPNLETHRLFERRPVIDPDEGAQALEDLTHQGPSEIDALDALQADHVDGLQGLYQIAMLEKIG